MIKPINFLLDSVPFSQHWYSLDWHPPDHISFLDNLDMRSHQEVSAAPAVGEDMLFYTIPPVKQKLWPRHCVQVNFRYFHCYNNFLEYSWSLSTSTTESF